MAISLLFAFLQTASVSVGGATAPPADTLLPPPDSAAMATAYADAATRELVRLAREHRGLFDASVFRYRALVRQRVSVGLRALRRDRLLFRRESAERVDWRRDGVTRVEVLGAREAIPVAIPGVQIPDDLEDWAQSFIPEPGADRLWLTPDEDGFAWHPLVRNGESVYRYATGDTTVIRLPDGRSIRLVELRVTPRRRDIRLVTGSFWIEMDDHAIVQAVFRPARDFDLDRDMRTLDPDDAEDTDDIPGILKPVRFEIRYITVEYGLWEMRWWLPRLMAFDGSLQLGAAHFPLDLEVTYSDYEVEPDRFGLPELPPLKLKLAGVPGAREKEPYWGYDVVIPDDTSALLTSEFLPPSIFTQGQPLIAEADLRDLGERLDLIPAAPWALERPVFSWPWALRSGLVRYNRVEGLSLGARVDWDLGRLQADLTGRLGTADLVPRAELGLQLPTLRRTWRLAGYRRLASSEPALRPFGIANSLGALLVGRDDGLYFAATGAELTLSPAVGEGHYRLRLYGEHQAPVFTGTDFSVPHAFDTSRVFADAPGAATADQVGMALGFGTDRGLDPTGFRWGAWLDVTAETGTYDFVRPGLTLHGGAPLPGRLMGALELGGGTTLGPGDEPESVSPQARWFLGGAPTLRGFAAGAFAGRDYARARLEVANDFPGARVALFSDAGWAGDRADFESADVAVSVGVGGSVLDGLVRIDIARAIRPVRQWRADIYFDALF